MKNHIHLLIFTFCLVILCGSLPAYSDNERSRSISPLDKASKREVTIVKDNHNSDFINPTLDNLSRLYWRLGVFDTSDDYAIDNYLRINECGIFTSYYHDEFEWIDIRNKTRKMLEQNKHNFENNFKFVMPVSLGAYDPDRGGFQIINDTGFPNLKRIEFISPYRRKEICNNVNEIPDYGRNILLILDQPLNYNFVAMDDHVAQAFILRRQAEAQDIDENLRIRRYSRQAYVRIRAQILEYQGTVEWGASHDNLAILYGTLEGIDVFDDFEQNLLLASYTVEELNALNEQGKLDK